MRGGESVENTAGGPRANHPCWSVRPSQRAGSLSYDTWPISTRGSHSPRVPSVSVGAQLTAINHGDPAGMARRRTKRHGTPPAATRNDTRCACHQALHRVAWCDLQGMFYGISDSKTDTCILHTARDVQSHTLVFWAEPAMNALCLFGLKHVRSYGVDSRTVVTTRRFGVFMEHH